MKGKYVCGKILNFQLKIILNRSQQNFDISQSTELVRVIVGQQVCE